MEANIGDKVKIKDDNRLLIVESKEFNEYAGEKGEMCYGLKNGYYIPQSEIVAVEPETKEIGA